MTTTILTLMRDFALIVSAVMACGFIFAVLQHFALEPTPLVMGSTMVGAIGVALLLRRVAT